jgi:hypothetical protein
MRMMYLSRQIGYDLRIYFGRDTVLRRSDLERNQSFSKPMITTAFSSEKKNADDHMSDQLEQHEKNRDRYRSEQQVEESRSERRYKCCFFPRSGV